MRILSLVLLLAGLYLVFVHAPPLPLNHEAVGLGTTHDAHTMFGVVLLIAAAVVFWLGRRRGASARAA